MATDKCTLSNKEIADKLNHWANALAKSGGNAWSLRVPVDFNHDPDMLMVEAAKRLEALPESPSPVPEDVEAIAKDYADDYVERQGSHDRPDITHHDYTKGFLAGHAYKGEQGGIPLSVIEVLDAANPYTTEGEMAEEMYYTVWSNCVSKLRELLQSQPETDKEVKP